MTDRATKLMLLRIEQLQSQNDRQTALIRKLQGNRVMEHDLVNLRDQVREHEKLMVEEEAEGGSTNREERLLWDCIAALLDVAIERQP